MTRLWPEGVPVEAEVRDGSPVAFIWEGRRREVSGVVDQWVIHDEWWREEIWRHYFQVATVDGLLLVIYQNLLGGGWYVERIYD